MITREDLQSFLKTVDNEESIIDTDVVINDTKHYFEIVEGDQDDWDDDGKYQYSNYVAQLVEIDDNFNEVKRYELYVREDVSRTGSYYTDYYYGYERTIVEKHITEVPEEIRVIPAHVIVEYK